jgi:hypothetical protein
MNDQDRQAIDRLFSRLAEAEPQAAPKDAEADAYIKRQIQQHPDAPYRMAQTIIVQNYALEQAQQRIQELEEQAGERVATANPGSGIFGGLFGESGRPAASTPRTASVPAGNPLGVPGPGPTPQAQGGGFLAGAAQTAMGVAGGVLLETWSAACSVAAARMPLRRVLQPQIRNRLRSSPSRPPPNRLPSRSPIRMNATEAGLTRFLATTMTHSQNNREAGGVFRP